MDRHAGRPRATVAEAAAPSAAVTLTLPRPESERSSNEYVEAPLRPAAALASRPAPPLRPPVVKQPAPASSKPGAGDCAGAEQRPSIVCARCGRCRCAACARPRHLPERWACNDSCLVSADAIVDYASCLCCVKGLFYHCSDQDDAAATCADEPCACAPDAGSAARWGCLAALSCALPCLWLYWPLRGCQALAEGCYARRKGRGCACAPDKRQPPTKRLLASGTDF